MPVKWPHLSRETETPMALRYLTAGESHGPALTAILEGLPAGLALSEDLIAADLARRQTGAGSGDRMSLKRTAP
jgi:chorismate synthase